MSWSRDAVWRTRRNRRCFAGTTWYLAEGATHSGFNLFYLLQNPNAVEAQVASATSGRAGRRSRRPIAATESRTNIWVDVEEFDGQTLLASTDVSAVFEVTQRPADHRRARDVSRPPGQFQRRARERRGDGAGDGLVPGGGRDRTVLRSLRAHRQPGRSGAQSGRSSCCPDGPTITQGTPSRPTAASTSGSTSKTRFSPTPRCRRPSSRSTTSPSSSSAPCGGRATAWFEAHNSPGATVTGTRWALAEGEAVAGADVETYILLANTSPTDRHGEGHAAVRGWHERRADVHRLGHSRFNVPVRPEFPEAVGRRFGAIVESARSAPAQIVVERAMYWDALDSLGRRGPTRSRRSCSRRSAASPDRPPRRLLSDCSWCVKDPRPVH